MTGRAGFFRYRASGKPLVWWLVRYATDDGDDADIGQGEDAREVARSIAVDAGGYVVAIDGPYETNSQALAALAGVQL